MIEEVYHFTTSSTKLIERILDDDQAAINHMILAKGEALPEHYTNSHVYLLITGGTLSLRLEEEDVHLYEAGNIVNIPYKTKMNIINPTDEILEFFVIKAPSPRKFHQE